MIYSLENSKIKMTASTHGGEMHSLTCKKEGTEYLWNGNPEYWKYHSPILFPIIGKVMNSKFMVDGQTYELPAHGLARTSEFEMIAMGNDFITFELKYSEDLLEIYPYKFSLCITYTLEDNAVKVTYDVINLDDKDIYFSIGAHPAFMCPIEKNELLEDCYLEFSESETTSVVGVNKDVYLSREKREFLSSENILPLSKELFKNGLLMFEDLKSNKITIKSRKNDKSLSVEFDGFPYLCLWAPEAGAPFLCIEPWFGHPEYEDFNGEFKDREGTVSLSIGKAFNCSYKIAIE
ncbi:aldose 1-epimerase family protein [Clostridium beijerinckii]|uniref:aldose 1-epimerase family protein n=1 Tax=Clostridium beijerinckii TaxID=1520 RepID=UPI00098BDCF7|nr:aldose 1-epimerase family protein [Clostridium beijerinckii]NRT77831.1 galactose mutarotase-like enzyme [Clostridium beijerinckii]OOM36333.1 aldose 1-epimerase [Clostridium beijerinckii]